MRKDAQMCPFLKFVGTYRTHDRQVECKNQGKIMVLKTCFCDIIHLISY